jgi:hypothetical protein
VLIVDESFFSGSTVPRETVLLAESLFEKYRERSAAIPSIYAATRSQLVLSVGRHSTVAVL